MKRELLKEKVWTLNNINQKSDPISKWKLTIDVRNEYEPFDNSTDYLEPNDKIDTELRDDLVNKIESYTSKLGSANNKEYELILYFLKNAKTSSQWDTAWTKFQEYLIENNIYLRSNT